MRSLVVYYSKTNNTKKVADLISSNLDSDLIEIKDNEDRDGILNYIKSGYHAFKKKKTEISYEECDIDSYDLILIGTPIWAGSISPAVRTYIDSNKNKFKKVSFFSTVGSTSPDSTFKEMEELSEKTPISILSIKKTEFEDNSYISKAENFCNDIVEKYTE